MDSGFDSPSIYFHYKKLECCLQNIHTIKQQKQLLISPYSKASNVTGLWQIINTLGPMAGIWLLVARYGNHSITIVVGAILALTLFTLRTLVLMHECGHRSLFNSRRLNTVVGFMLGVITGMPQFVWSQHHDYHHVNNGNWEKYRGPLTSPSVEEFAALSDAQRRNYLLARHIAMAPLGGFVYLLFNPRFTWLKGSMQLLLHLLKSKLAQPQISFSAHAKTFKTRYWQSSQQYWHMFWNNVVLISLWPLMCWCIGTGLFFSVYVISVSLAGGAGIMLFTVQHNFEHAYASTSEGWDYDQSAVRGTSFLVLPRWLNWFTANIGYHHVHHLSAKIPNYRLAEFHNKYQHLFVDVRRVTLRQIPYALTFLIWDAAAKRIISVAEFQHQLQNAVPQATKPYQPQPSN